MCDSSPRLQACLRMNMFEKARRDIEATAGAKGGSCRRAREQ